MRGTRLIILMCVLLCVSYCDQSENVDSRSKYDAFDQTIEAEMVSDSNIIHCMSFIALAKCREYEGRGH